MSKEELERIVAFCILMQGNGGILNKAPQYIAEKFTALIKDESQQPIAFLDSFNQDIFKAYFARWFKEV